MPNRELKQHLDAMGERFGLSPDAVASAIAFALDQPVDVDVDEIVVRPTAQP